MVLRQFSCSGARRISTSPWQTSPLLLHAHQRRIVHRASSNTPKLAASLSEYRTSLQVPAATHNIRNLPKLPEDATVIVHGYLGARSDLNKNLSFVKLLSEDLYTNIQLVVENKTLTDGDVDPGFVKTKAFKQNSAVAIQGKLKQRKSPKKKQADASNDVGKQSELDKLEIKVIDAFLLNEFPTNIRLTDDYNAPPEQRHLQLRKDPSLRDALVFRANLANHCREFLNAEHGFVEIETPLLFKSTPEGAREFLVPTRDKGQAYALPQSPQQYKQILMASGVSKYFQIAKCFRDEDLRADRQPEFTQLDLEMSFVQATKVMETIEGLIKFLWRRLLHVELPDQPFNILSYSEAMTRYGSDKPDVRLDIDIMEIGSQMPSDLLGKIGPLSDPKVDAFKFSVSEDPKITQKFVGTFMDSPTAKAFLDNPDGQPGIFVFDPRKPLNGLFAFGHETAGYLEQAFDLSEGDLLVIQARKNLPFYGGSTMLGNLRLALHKAALQAGLIARPQGHAFLWINSFPLFSPANDEDPGQGGSAGIISTHHPFTAPATVNDLDKVLSSPLEVTANHYDLVLNGIELGGGSQRIHNAAAQEFILRDVLKISEERMKDFAHLLEVLRAGCPPHAGIALGFDRLCAVMLGKDSIRDVIAFPKSGKGEDLLIKSPSQMTAKQLDNYHLQLKT